MVMEKVELLRAACCIAGSDGEITDREQESLQMLADHAGVGAASLRAMMELAVKDPKFHQDQLEMVHKDPQQAFETLYRVSRREPGVPEDERDLLVRFGRKLGLSLDEMNGIIQRVHAK